MRNFILTENCHCKARKSKFLLTLSYNLEYKKFVISNLKFSLNQSWLSLGGNGKVELARV